MIQIKEIYPEWIFFLVLIMGGIFMNHSQLINIASALGYTPENSGITIEGLCKGYTMMWVRAVCSGKLDAFNARLKILEHFKDSPQELVALLKKARQVKDPDAISPNELHFLNIPAFFESIALYLNPHSHFELFNESIHAQDEDKIGAFLDGDQPDMAFATCHRSVDNYTETKLKDYLNLLAETLNNQPECVIEFNSLKHSVAARVNEKGNFLFMDVNQNSFTETGELMTFELTPKELAEHLMQKSLHRAKVNDQLVMASTVYSRESLKDEIGSKFQEMPFELSSGTDAIRFGIALKIPGVAEAISREDNFYVHASGSALILAAMKYNNYPVAEALFGHKKFNPDKMNFVELAVYFSQFSHQQIKDTCALFTKAGLGFVLETDVYRAFNKSTETDNHQLLEDLILCARPSSAQLMVKRLISDGHDFIAPFNHSFSDKHIEMVKSFIDAKYDVNYYKDGELPPLMKSISSPGIVQLLLNHGADPNVEVTSGSSILQLACSMNPIPGESIKILITNDSTKLHINQLSLNSSLYVAINAMDDGDLKKQFVIKALEAYIQGSAEEFRFGILFSKEEKIEAAQALLANIQQGKSIDPKYDNALKDGRLGQIASVLPVNKTNEYRLYIQKERENSFQDDFSSTSLKKT